jgi:hypothetical protein
MQPRSERLCSWPDRAARSPEGVAGLSKMATLHALAARPAASDGHTESSDYRLDLGQLGLVLLGHPFEVDFAPAVGTAARQLNIDGLVRLGAGRQPVAVAAVGLATLPAGTRRLFLRVAFRERGRLALARAPRVRQGPLELCYAGIALSDSAVPFGNGLG